jgi:uncharacterized protein DUF4389
MNTTPSQYPIRVTAELQAPLSRGLWLAKWFLLIPHYVVLVCLWIGFLAATIVAGFAILFTGRYPRTIFAFTSGVLRWTWRVQYYGYDGLGTDRYPPFTMADVPDYPARLDIDYPEHLSRGLVLVKWWLLVLPHYLVLAFFLGGNWFFNGLVGVLVLIAAVTLLFTGRYPRQINDFVVGMNRWAFRVLAYAALMTDQYPPLRLDQGGSEPTTQAPAAPQATPTPTPTPVG